MEKEENVKKGYWLKDNEANLNKLKELWPNGTRAEILATFPEKKWRAIAVAANRYGIVRRKKDKWIEEQVLLIREYFSKGSDESVANKDRQRFKLELIAKINDIAKKESLVPRNWSNILTEADQMGLTWNGDDSLEERFIAWIKTKTRTIDDVSNYLNRATKECFRFIDSLRARGYPIDWSQQARTIYWQEGALRDGATELPPLTRNKFKALIISDVNIGHRAQQLTLLHTLYHLVDIGYKDNVRGVDFSDIDVIFLLGNLFAGSERRGTNSLFLRGFDEQVPYAAEHFPRLQAKIKTYILSGPAELELNRPIGRGKNKVEARNPLQTICHARDDLVYIGDLSHTFEVTGTDVKIFVGHTTKKWTQSLYTKSLPLDRVEDSFNDLSPRRKHQKSPTVILLGGYHVPMYSPPIIEGIERHSIMVPSFCDPLSADRDREKQGSTPVIGFALLSIDFDGKKEKISYVSHTHHSWTNHQILNDYLAVPAHQNGKLNGRTLTEDEKQILDWLHKEEAISVGEVGRRLDRPHEKVKEIFEGLGEFGVYWDSAKKRYLVERPKRKKFAPISDVHTFLNRVYAETARRVIYSDTHFGSLQEQPHVLKRIEEVIRETGVDTVFHAGDVLDGEFLYGKKHARNVFVSAAKDQRERAKKLLPRIDGVTTFMISGSHDQVFNTNSGDDPIEFLVEQRPDLVYLGPDRGIHVDEKTGIVHMLLHPSGGVPKGRSYRLQEVVRTLSEAVDVIETDVQALFVGHLHIALFMRWRGMDVFLVPCAQSQTEYLIKKTLFPKLGCWFVLQTVDEDKDPTLVTLRYYAVSSKKYKVFTDLYPADCEVEFIVKKK